MSDYASLKVPDLKKLLSERSLPQTGNKADLIARLQENDKSMSQSLRCPLTPLLALSLCITRVPVARLSLLVAMARSLQERVLD